MIDDIESILIPAEEIHKRIAELGGTISKDFSGRDPLFVGILKGSFMFMADLMRCVTIPCSMDFMVVSSYGNKSVTTGAVKINTDLSEDIEGRHVIVVEDILDSGLTLSYLSKYLINRSPASLSIVTLLDKPSRRLTEVEAAYRGFVVPDAFVVGYGRDYAERYRNLPFIGILKPAVYMHEGA
jgi:hypoxanthine phosphoribosyltransferase